MVLVKSLSQLKISGLSNGILRTYKEAKIELKYKSENIWMSFISYVLLIFILMNQNEIKASKIIQKPFSMGCNCGKIPEKNSFVERHFQSR